MKTHEVIIINECRLPRGGTLFTYSVLQTFLRISFVSKVFCTFAAYMRRLPHILLCLWALCMLIGCAGDGYTPTLRMADSLMNDSPSVALAMLDSLKGEAQGWSKARRMRYHLLTMKAQNKAYVDFTSDSLAKDVVEYYDNHGTANDRLLAHYLLGCVYRDLGESPHAVDCFLDAAACADTTARDCDYYTLSSVYSQMGRLYHKQLLLSYEIDACKKASHFAARAGDTLHMIYNMDIVSGAYILQNKIDSAELILNKAGELYHQYGFVQEELRSSAYLMSIYIEQKENLHKAKSLMDRYEANCSIFDTNGQLPSSKRIFYYYKGRYYDQLDKLDSAEYFYRKIYRPKMSYTAMDPMYRGLMSVFQKRHLADSLAKYARLFSEANDSSIAKKDQTLTAQMTASYNYSRYQKKAADNARKISWAIGVISALVFVFTTITIIVVLLWKKKKEIHRKQIEEFNRLKDEYESANKQYRKNIHTLELLEKSHQTIIATIQGELDSSIMANKTYQQNYAKIQQEKVRISEQYEISKQQLIEENRSLSVKIKELEQKTQLSTHLDAARKFLESDIVKLIRVKEKKPLSELSARDWNLLTSTVEIYYPDLLRDLKYLPKATLQKTRACILVLLKTPDSCIANWLDIKPNRLSNLKAELNIALFGESSARTLFDNLRRKYDFIQEVK